MKADSRPSRPHSQALNSDFDSVAPDAASPLVQEFRKLWDQGERIEAQEFLKRYPELALEKDFVVDVAYEEFTRRTDAGEKIDAQEFAGRFPRFKTSLGNLLVAHEFFQQGLGLQWPEVGQSFQGYHLLSEIGKGGFAHVYLAQEEALGKRLVVLKVTGTGLAEANLLGRLQHENIVPIYSVGYDAASKMSLVCMPYMGKSTLCDVLDLAFPNRQDFTPANRPRSGSIILQAAREGGSNVSAMHIGTPSPVLVRGNWVHGVLHLGRELASALAYVHERGIYHRDLKPSNILLGPDGRAMLLDFNLSADTRADGQDTGSPLGGTVPYMSPEQLRATEPGNKNSAATVLDARADIYSLGVILYECLAGQLPFGSVAGFKTPEEVRQYLAAKQVGKPLPLRQLNPDVDPGVVRIVERCLAYQPEDRYGSAEELLGDLQRALSPVGRLRRTLRKSSRVLVACGFLAAALTVAAVAVIQYPRSTESFPDQMMVRGVEAFRGNKHERAVVCFSEALEKRYDWKTLVWRARAYQQLDDLGSALADLSKAQKTTNDPSVLAAIGFCYQMHRPLNRVEHSLAIHHYNRAIEGGFKNAAIYNNLGYSLARLRPEEARAALLKAIELDPKLQIAHYNLAEVSMLDLNNPAILDQGVRAIEKALQLGPALPQMLRLGAELNAHAAKTEPACKERATELTCQALEAGVNPSLFKAPVFRDIVADPQVKRALGDVNVPDKRGPRVCHVVDALAYNQK